MPSEMPLVDAVGFVSGLYREIPVDSMLGKSLFDTLHGSLKFDSIEVMAHP